ncbi:hypothetical protein [Paenibacillus endoradicis]|uniref:hypothetical protein n=1 Tax=Paenibacillus endoradicis TaxID=2972487 RepID=UPI002158C788|nr:hypothetical protein [Paenibacillus endoradicis]MCR8658897.1 hypothetical protein [Paenibacillus endoradicis]
MRAENKSPLVAFLLSLLPGFGHLYIGRVFRFIVYAGGFFGPLGLLFIISIFDGYVDGESFALAAIFSGLFGVINMLDMLITIAGGKHRAFQPASATMERDEYGQLRYVYDPLEVKEQSEKTKVMMMSIIPGLGHMYMGLLTRGITLMVLFVGVFGVTLFLGIVLDTLSILILWLALPIIWIYGMFDALALLASRQKGEEINDESLFSNMESYMADGRKNRVTAIGLSIFPGAGHLYLGLQQRGLQLMGSFLVSIFIMDQLHLTIFLFLLPLLWCYAFFDIMFQLRRWEQDELKDEPFVAMFIPYQRWIGIGLLVVGIYYLFDKIASRLIEIKFPEWSREYYELKYMLPTAVIAFVMIVLGMKLLFGTSSKRNTRDEGGNE